MSIRDYFERHTGPLKGKVLDWYCLPEFLKDHNEEIEEYVGCNVDADKIEKLKMLWPGYNWHYFNHYNPRLNKLSRSKKLPNIEGPFDYAFSHGLIATNTVSNLDRQLNFIRNMSNECYFTFIIKEEYTWEGLIMVHPGIFTHNDLEKWDEINENNVNYIVPSANGGVDVFHNEDDLKAKNDYFLALYSQEFLLDRYGGEILNLNEHYTTGSFSYIKTLHLRNE